MIEMMIGQAVSVPYSEFKQLIKDSQKLADIKSLYEKSSYSCTEDAKAILGIEEKEDGD